MYFHVMPTKREQRWSCVQEKRKAPDKDQTCREEDLRITCATLLHCRRRPQIRRYFQELISEYWSQNPMRTERLNIFFQLILCELLLLQSEKVEDGKPETMLEEARGQIQSNRRFFTVRRRWRTIFLCAPGP